MKKWPVKYDCVVLLQKMADNKEQNFHVSNWGRIVTETFEMLKLSFREEIVSRNQAFCWLPNFKSRVMLKVWGVCGRIKHRDVCHKLRNLTIKTYVTIHKSDNKLGILFGIKLKKISECCH